MNKHRCIGAGICVCAYVLIAAVGSVFMWMT